MKKEEIIAASQILNIMREGVETLEKAEKKKDLEKIKNVKSEILNLQKKIKEILNNDG